MAEVNRNCSLSGYNEVFVNPVDKDLLCKLCQLPSREPKQIMHCGDRFCSKCIDEYFQRQERKDKYLTCPLHVKHVLERDKDVFPDKAAERKILSLDIICCNEGCNWTIQLGEKKSHLEACHYEVVSCTQENCRMMVKRKDHDAHVTTECPWRLINCFYCQEPHAECQMEGHHERCRKFPIPCRCGEEVSREEVQDHINNICPKTLIRCQFHMVGCEKKVPREELQSHLKSASDDHDKLVQEERTKRNNRFGFGFVSAAFLLTLIWGCRCLLGAK